MILRKSIASKGCVAACVALIICALIGSYIFKFFAITLDAFRIMGGILFFRSGLKMIEANVSRTRSTPKEQEEGLLHDDIAVSPIGIPLIAGPGAITASMVLSGQSHGVVDYGILVVAIVVVMILTYFILSGANSLAKRLGATGTRIIQRIMGLILLVIATQFVINGVTPVLEGILIRVEH